MGEFLSPRNLEFCGISKENSLATIKPAAWDPTRWPIQSALFLTTVPKLGWYRTSRQPLKIIRILVKPHNEFVS